MSNKTVHSSDRRKRRKSIHYQILLYTLSFLSGSLGPIIFYHTHMTKDMVRKFHQRNGEIRIQIKGQSVRGRAFVDTGNSLREPVTGKAAHLVRYQFLKPCLDMRARRVIEGFYGGFSWKRQETPGAAWEGFRLIPYRAVGTEKGVLLGITADEMVFTDHKRKYIEDGCVIVPYPGKPFGKNGYEALLHPEILRK